jgi:hypothetical protein
MRYMKWLFVAASLISLGEAYRSQSSRPSSDAEGKLGVAPVATAPSAPPVGNAPPWSPAQGLPLLTPNLDPFASLALNNPFARMLPSSNSLQTLRELRRNKSLPDAQLDAVRSGDPLVHVNSLFMMMPCMSEAVTLAGGNARALMERLNYDSKTGRPKAEAVPALQIEFAELRANSGPQRLHPPEHARKRIRQAMEESIEVTMERIDRGQRDYAAEMQLWRETRAPLDDTEAAAYSKVRDALAVECSGQIFASEFGKAYRDQRAKFASQGVASALLFNDQAGWTSGQRLAELSDRDYELVAKGFREQQPDVLASLLLRSRIHGDSTLLDLPDDAYFAQLALGHEVTRIAACELNVADCSPAGNLFQEACLSYGGCDRPDLVALWRHVLERDGLNPNAFDRAVADLVAKIRAADLDGLGIHRKK